MDVVAVVLGGTCSERPLPKKSGLLGVCGEAGSKLSSRVAFVVALEVSRGEGCSLAVAVASEMERRFEGVPMNVSIADSRV